jgi:hypothetical protein
MTKYLRPIMPEFYHVLALSDYLAYSSIDFPNLSIIFLIFLHNTLDTINIITSFNFRPPPMCVHTSHQPYAYPPFTLCPW